MPEVNTVELEVNNIRLCYEVCGEGRPLLLLHGNGEDHTIFDTAVQILKPFSGYMRSIPAGTADRRLTVNCTMPIWRKISGNSWKSLI